MANEYNELGFDLWHDMGFDGQSMSMSFRAIGHATEMTIINLEDYKIEIKFIQWSKKDYIQEINPRDTIKELITARKIKILWKIIK